MVDMIPITEIRAMLYEHKGEHAYITCMSAMSAQRMVPLETSRLIDARVGLHKFSLWDTFVDTDYGIAIDGTRILLFPHLTYLRNIHEGVPLVSGGLPLSKDAMPEAVSFPRSGIMINSNCSEKRARQDELLLYLARDSKHFEEYLERVYRFLRDRHSLREGMGIHLPCVGVVYPIALGPVDSDRKGGIYARPIENDLARLLAEQRRLTPSELEQDFLDSMVRMIRYNRL